MFIEHEQIVLTAHIHGDHGEQLKPGDVGVVIHVHPGAEAYVAEFMALDNHTVAIATVLPSQARHVTSQELIHARNVGSAV